MQGASRFVTHDATRLPKGTSVVDVPGQIATWPNRMRACPYGTDWPIRRAGFVYGYEKGMIRAGEPMSRGFHTPTTDSVGSTTAAFEAATNTLRGIFSVDASSRKTGIKRIWVYECLES